SRAEVKSLQQQQLVLTGQIRDLQRERDEAIGKLAARADENGLVKNDASELLRLRSEVTRLKNRLAELENDPAETTARAWVDRVNRLKQRLEQNPQARIPELRFVTEEDWLEVARYKLETEDDYRRALASLRGIGSRTFADSIFKALKEYLKANN